MQARTAGARHWHASVLLLLSPLILLCLFSLPHTTSALPISGSNCTLTFPPLSPSSLYGNATLRTVYLQARDSTGAALSTGGALFTASLFSSTPSCDTNLTYPHCLVTCSPLSSPYPASPGCLSSPTPSSFPSPSPPNYVPINVTDLGTGLYSLTYLPSHPDLYSLTLNLLTQGGLLASYYDNTWQLPPSSLTRIDAAIAFNWGSGPITPTAVDYVSVRWQGKLRPPVSETFTLYAIADDWVRVWVDRRLVLEAWGSGCCNETWGSVLLQAGYSHDLIVDYAEVRGNASISLSWRSASIPKQLIPSSSLYYRTPIQGSPFTNIAIGPGDPWPTTSTAYDTDAGLLGGRVGGLSVGVAGVVGGVLVRAVDVFGNVNTNATANASLITSTFTGPDPIASTTPAAYLSAGVYLINYTAAVSGSYALAIRIAGVSLPSSPFTVAIAPASTSPLSSTVVALPTAATAGLTSTFYVQLKDSLSNNRTATTADSLYASWSTGGLSYQGVTSIAGPGLFASSFTPTLAGAYTLAVFVDGISVTSTSLTVAAGALTPSTSTATGGGLTAATAGVPANLSVISRDAFGNVRPGSTTAFVYNLTVSGGVVGVVGGVLTGVGAGLYNGSYTLNATGPYTLTVTSGGVQVAGSPWQVRVSAGGFCPSATSLVSSLPSFLTSDILTTFSIQSRDAVGNPLPLGGTALTLTLQCAGSPTTGSVQDLGTGVYEATVTPLVAGAACAMYVLGGGGNISGSPFTVLVKAGAATGASVPGGAGRTAGVAGAQSAITLAAVDAAGNSVGQGGATVVASVVPLSPLPSSAAPSVTVSDFSTGAYTLTYTPLVAGSYSTSVGLQVSGGLRGSYYSDGGFSTLVATRVDAAISFTWLSTPPVSGMASGYYSVSWAGYLTAPYTASYTLYVATIADTGTRLIVGTSTLISAINPATGSSQYSGSISLQAGVMYPFSMQYTTLASGGQVLLQWSCTGHFSLQPVPSSVLSFLDPVIGSPWTTLITPSTSTATTSTYTLTPPTLTVGVPFTTTITLRDTYGNLQATTTEASAITVVLTTGASVAGTVTSVSAGVYQAVMTPAQAGSATVRVTYVGVQVGAVTSATIALGVLSPSLSSVVTPAALTPVYAGVAQTFLVQTRDVGGNSLASDTHATYPLAVVLTSTSPGGYSIPSVLAYTGAGVYSVSYTPVHAATYSLALTFGGVAIASSPFSVVAYAGLASPTATHASLPFGNATASLAATLTSITAADSYGNPASSGGLLFACRLALLTSPTTVVYATSTDHGDGTYILQYTATTPGLYLGDIQLAAAASPTTPGTGSGLTGTYYNNRWLSPPIALQRVDPVVSFSWGNDSSLVAITPSARDYVSVSWTGFARVDVAGSYTFTVSAGDGARLYVDDLSNAVMDHFVGPAGVWATTVTLNVPAASTLVAVRLDYRHNVYLAYVQLNWSCTSCGITNQVVPTTRLYPAATSILTTQLAVQVT